MTEQELQTFARVANHLSDGNIVMRELKDAVQQLPERISVTVQPPVARIRSQDLFMVAGLAAFIGAFVGLVVACR